MATKYHQISLSDIFSDCQNSFIDESPSFFSLLSEHFDLNEFIPPEFPTAFYLSIGRKRLYPYRGFLSLSFFKRFFPSLRIPCFCFFASQQRIKRVLGFH